MKVLVVLAALISVAFTLPGGYGDGGGGGGYPIGGGGGGFG